MPPSVSEVVWNRGKQADGAKSVRSLSRHLRRRAAVQALVMAVVGALLWWLFGHRIVAVVVWGLAAVALLLGFTAPSLYRYVDRFGRFLGRVVGTALTYVLMTPLYYLVFTPGALLLRLQRRDPLHRGPLPHGLTGWIPRRHRPAPESYARQFFREDRQARALQRPVGSEPVAKDEASP